MSGSSRKDSGVGSKSRYPSLNLSHSYKGPGHDYKSNQKRGAMQSLGKISTNARRMPAPAQLRSLKSSNDGQDPSVALVPQGGGGWTKDEEKEKEKEDPLNYTRKTEKPQKTVVPEGFKTNFPSLEEQEKMSKKEREELEKRQREEDNCVEDESKESPSTAPPPSSRGHHSRKQPKEAWGGNQEEPPYHQGGGQPPSHSGGPVPQGLYHQRRDRQPYMPHPRTGRYPSGPPPSYHQNPHYRHTGAPYHPHHHGYPQPHPPFIDPYSIPPKDQSANPRPSADVPTGLESSLKDSEHQLEEDDDGWAGHQEEVDYSKEVVFEDSSDEDSPKKGQKEQSKARTKIDEERVLQNTQENLLHHHHSKQDPPQNMPHPPHGGHAPYPQYDYHHPPPMPYPPYPPSHAAGWYQPYHQQQGGRGDHSYDQDPNRPPGGRPPPQTTNVGGKNRRNQHPTWSESSNEGYTNWTRSDGGAKNDGDLMTTDKVSKNQTHFESIQSPLEPEPLVTPPTDTISRNQPKKIMIRDLGDKVDNGSAQQHGQRATGDKDSEGDNHKKVVWGGVKSQTTQPPQDSSSGYQQNESPVPPLDEPQAVLKDRGPVQSSKTLYEPEGRTSQEKFRKYQRSMSGGGGTSEHHTHAHVKHKKTSRSDSRGSEGDGKSPVSMADEATTEEERKRVLIKKPEDKPDGDHSTTRGREKSWKGDGKRDRDSKGGSGRYDERRRSGGPIEKGGNDRRKDSHRDETNQHEPRGNTKPHPPSSHQPTKRTKSEEEYKQPQPQRGSGKGQQDAKVSHKQNTTTTTKPVSSNKRQNDRHDSDADNTRIDGGHKTRNNADKPDSRTHPSRRVQTEVTRPDRQDRNKPPRQDGSHHDTRAPQSHSKQSDSRYPPQDQVRGSGSKSRREYQSTQNTSEGSHSHKSRPVQPYRGQQKGRDSYKETTDYNEDDDNVFEDQGSSSTIDQHGSSDTRAGRTSKPSKTANEPKQKDTRHDPVSSRPNPVSSRQDPVPSRQDPVPLRHDLVPSRQDPGSSHSTRPSRSRDHNKHDSSNRFNEPHNKPDSSSSRKGSKHRQDPNPPAQDPNPLRHDPNPSRLDPNPARLDPNTSRQDPNPPKQESNPSRQDPNPPRLDPIPPRQDPNPPRQDPNPRRQDPNSRRQDPNSHRQDPVPHRQNPIPPKQDPIPPRLDLDPLKQDSKQESRWDPPPSAKQDHERHHNKEPKPSRDENTRSKPKPEPKEPDQRKDLEFGGSKRRQDYDEYDQDYNERYKRRSNTREERGGHSGRGRGGRWGRGYGDYEDDDYRSAPSFRRNNRRYEEDESDNYPSRTFDRSKKGGGRGRDRRGGGSGRVGRDGNNDREISEKKDATNKAEEKRTDEIEEKQPAAVLYMDLDDIDSPSDWDEDNEGGGGEGVDIPPNNKRKPSENDRPRYRERGGGARKYSRNYSERNKRNERYHDESTAGARGGQRQQQHHGSSNTGKKDSTDSFDKDLPPSQDPPVLTTKDSNFNKYDINAHNVVVVDRRSSLSDGEGQFVGVADEGFIKVKSKRDKHKDREDRKKTDGNFKRGDEHSGRHKGFIGRGPEQSNNGGKGWGHVQQKKTESVSRDGNGDWTINEGRSAYGAIGDKPSKEKGSSSDDTRKTTNPSANPGYKLFETADNKGKNTPFSFDSPLSNTPRKGERLQAAIDITLPQNMAHLTNEQSTIVSDVSATQKGHDLPSTESVSSSGVKSSKEQQVSKNVEESESHPRMGGARGDNKHRKAKTEQRFYTPPAARPDTGGHRGQRSHTSSSKHGTTSTTHSKVHHHDDPEEHQMGDTLEEDSSPSSRHHDNTKKETAVVRGVYLQQHQGLGGHMMVSDDTTNQASGNNEGIVSTNIDNNGPHPFDSVNETNDNDHIRKVHVLKELTSNKSLTLPSSVSSTKFGSVSYASALKMKAQAKSIKGGGGVIIDETVPSDMANLLSPKLNRRSGGDGLLVNYTGEDSDCASGGAGEFDSIIPLHDVLREAVLTHSDENEVDGGSTHRYTPSSPRQSEDALQACYPVPVAPSGQPPGVSKPMSPSTQFTKPFSPPVGGGALTGPFPKPSPLYSGIGVPTGEGSSLGVEQSSPSYTNEKDQDSMVGGGGVVKQLLKEENVRPSSAQSLSESPFIARLQQGGYGSGMGGGESSSHHGGSGNTSSGLPLTRVSSAPSHLPLNAIEQNEIVESDDTESVKTDDSISTSSKSILNIEANEFVPTQLARKRPSSQYSNQQKPQTRSVRGYQGQRARGGGAPVQNHQKGHTPHGGKQHYPHRHTSQQQPHSPNQQQSLLNKPPSLDMLLQLFLKNVQLLPTGGLALPPTQPTMPVPLSPLQTSQSVPHPSLPLNFPPMSSGSAMPYPVTHPPPTGVPMTQSRKMSQEGVVPPPHAGGMPHPSLASAPPLQYITTGSKVGGNVAPPTDSGTPEVGQVSNVIPSGNHPPPPPPYFTATPLHPNQTPPQMPTVIFPHPNHHLPSTRSSHATPINGPQVPQPLTIIPSLQLAPPRPPPVMVDQQTNSNNSRPPLLPTPPGFNLLHQSSAAATPTVMTPSIHHPNWPVNPPIRLGLPPNMQSHDRSSIIQFPHMPQSN